MGIAPEPKKIKTVKAGEVIIHNSVGEAAKYIKQFHEKATKRNMRASIQKGWKFYGYEVSYYESGQD